MDLYQLQQQLQGPHLAPVNQWQPSFCGELPLHITADGRWLYQGSEIKRQSLIKLFASVLTCQQQQYYLQTPVEKIRITVDDAPFLLLTSQWLDSPQGAVLQLTTNVGDDILLSHHFPLHLDLEKNLPYMPLWRGLHAKMHRNLYYQLVEQANTVYCNNQQHLQLKSAGYTFTLGIY